MEELRPEDLEELVQELEEESEQERAAEPLPRDVEELLRVLHDGSLSLTRQQAAERLGKLDTSSPQIVQALLEAVEHDDHHQVRMAAAEAQRAPVHQAVLQEHPDLIRRAESAREQAAGDREKQRALKAGEDRKKPMSCGAILIMIGVGVFWLVLLAVGVGFLYLAIRYHQLGRVDDARLSTLIGGGLLIALIPLTWLAVRLYTGLAEGSIEVEWTAGDPFGAGGPWG